MEWEIFEFESFTRSAKIEKGRLKILESWKEKKVGIRVIEKGRVGFVTSTEFNDDLIEKALKLARISEERLEKFPEGEFTRVKGIYDKKIENLKPEDIRDFVDEMINSALNYNVNPSQGLIEFSVEFVRLRNSFDTDMEYKSTYCSAYLECVYNGSSGFEIEESRGLVDFERVGKNAGELAVMSKNPQKIEGFYNVVLSPIALHQILSYTLYPAFSLENVLKGKSPLVELNKNYIGNVTLIDDGTLPHGLFTAPFDDEGVGSRSKVIFENGVLKGYITDFRHALIAKAMPTGNCFRNDDLYPSISPTNVILEFEEITQLEGVYIHSLIGAHTSNPVSGDFSLETMNAFLNDNPVRAMIYGNVYDLLRKVVAFGKDVRQIENTVTPSVEVENFKLV